MGWHKRHQSQWHRHPSLPLCVEVEFHFLHCIAIEQGAVRAEFGDDDNGGWEKIRPDQEVDVIVRVVKPFQNGNLVPRVRHLL